MLQTLCVHLLGTGCDRLPLGGTPQEIMCQVMYRSCFDGGHSVRRSEALAQLWGRKRLSPRIARIYLDPGGLRRLERDTMVLVDAYHSITMLRAICRDISDWVCTLGLAADDAMLLRERCLGAQATRQEMAMYIAVVMYIAIREQY